MFRAALNLLGLGAWTATDWRAWRPEGRPLDAARISALIKARNAARTAKDWSEADRLRGEIDALGVVLRDGPEGKTWEPKR